MKVRIMSLTISMLCCLMVLTSCVTTNRQNSSPSPSSNPQSMKPFALSSQDEIRIPLHTQDGHTYFPLDQLLRAIDLKMQIEDDQQIQIGDIDAPYKMTLQSTKAEVDEETITLSTPPILRDGQVFAPIQVVKLFFDDYVNYELQKDAVLVRPSGNDSFTIDDMELEGDEAPPSGAGTLFFQDDPDDPYREDIEESDVPVWSAPTVDDDSAIPTALKNIDMNALIREARRYMGVPYLFGASAYPKSKKFDCSSYTQYIYGKFGVSLSRVSRNQAKQGVSVSRSKLRKGDLVFFSVPGRFKSNKVVGHVGIYIGSGKMINTFSNKKGVHITDINKGYWSTKYLGAKRVAY